MQQKEQSFSQTIARIPFANRLLCGIFILTWILDFVGITSKYLLTTSKTLYPNFEIWRIFTASFCIQSLLELFIVCINFYTFAPKLQQRTSSLYILVNFLVMGTGIQFLFALIGMFLPESILPYIGAGAVTGVWFYFIFKYCYFNAKTQIKFCCFDFRITKLTYVFVLLAIWSLFAWALYLDAAIGILLAFLECRFFQGRGIHCQSDGFLGFLSSNSSWVNAGSSFNSCPFEELQELVAIPRWSDSTKQSKQDYFSNKKGFKLSDA